MQLQIKLQNNIYTSDVDVALYLKNFKRVLAKILSKLLMLFALTPGESRKIYDQNLSKEINLREKLHWLKWSALASAVSSSPGNNYLYLPLFFPDVPFFLCSINLIKVPVNIYDSQFFFPSLKPKNLVLFQ